MYLFLLCCNQLGLQMFVRITKQFIKKCVLILLIFFVMLFIESKSFLFVKTGPSHQSRVGFIACIFLSLRHQKKIPCKKKF